MIFFHAKYNTAPNVIRTEVSSGQNEKLIFDEGICFITLSFFTLFLRDISDSI